MFSFLRNAARKVSLLAIAAIVLSAAACATAQDNQLMTLGAPSSNRFTLTDKTWPTEGQADICLWKDDAHAAVTITIDDNNSPDHAWWIQTCQQYGIKATWFIITHQVEANPGFSGPWSAFETLYNLGHDVQSHTVTHLNFDRGFDPDDPLHDIYVEYGGSIADIESHIPGNKVTTLAYPGGANTSYNDDDIAATYYIAARGTAGTINPAHKTNYIRTNSVSSGLKITNPSAIWSQLINLFDPSIRANDYRGWYCTHFHGLNDTLKTQVTDALDYLTQKDAEVGVWIGLFREVAMYGQQRDSATLTITSSTDSEIRFTLTDMMSDVYYQFPLTVKLHLPAAWNGNCAASQNGQPASVEVIEHEGAYYALIQAVPDCGEVTLTSQSRLAGDCNNDGTVDLDDFIILKQNYGNTGATADTGDFNGDGTVDLDDFIILKQNYGSSI